MGAFPRYCFKQPTASLIALGIRFAFKSTWALKPGDVYVIYANSKQNADEEKCATIFRLYKQHFWQKACYQTIEDLPFDQELGYMQVISCTQKQGKKNPNDIYYTIVIKLLAEAA